MEVNRRLVIGILVAVVVVALVATTSGEHNRESALTILGDEVGCCRSGVVA